MAYFIDVAYKTLNKKGEELPGDIVDIIRLEDSTIIVMADGLGSGVKANILATLTSKIAGTMLKEGVDIKEALDTIAVTLPVCKVRDIAYSTFTLIKICNDGSTYIAEYDNPPVFLIRNGYSVKIPRKKLCINGKNIFETNLNLKEGDFLTIVSDGVTHAGLGKIFRFGWQWENIEEFLKKSYTKNITVQNHVRHLLDQCWNFYDEQPGDDTTVIGIKIRKPCYVNIFTGPPKDKNNDNILLKSFINSEGKKVVCGGTAANIVARELNKRIRVNLDIANKDIPPTATIEGIDLVTEGVLTISKVVNLIKNYSNFSFNDRESSTFKGKDAVSKLLTLLIEECTHLTLWVGTAVNPAHQNPKLPVDLSIKLKLIEELTHYMKLLGKDVKINYI